MRRFLFVCMAIITTPAIAQTTFVKEINTGNHRFTRAMDGGLAFSGSSCSNSTFTGFGITKTNASAEIEWSVNYAAGNNVY